MYLAPITPHTLLPDMYFTSFPAHMSLYTHLLHLCTSSATQAWSTKGELFGYKADIKMSSMGKVGIRSCSLTRIYASLLQ